MGLLEDALRDTLAAQVAATPAVEDAAGGAIGRARRMGRRRTAVLGTAAAAVSMVLLGASVAALKVGPSGVAVGVVPPTAAGVEVWSAPLPSDVLTGNRITLATGPVISLDDLPPVRQAWRVSGGWLVRTADKATSAVWFVGENGSKTKLAEGDRVAVGRSGRAGHGGPMVAWGSAGRVSAATFADGHLAGPISTTGTGNLGPREIVGGGVLLADEQPMGETYDMWFPDRGQYVPGPRSTDRIIGVTGDGGHLFGLTGQSSTCLALVQPVGLAVARYRCDLGLRVGDVVSNSPDGRWLVALRGDGVDLYDFDGVWTSSVPVASWQVEATGVAWLPDGSFIVVDGFRAIRLRANASHREEVTQLDLTLAGGQSLTVISDLRD